MPGRVRNHSESEPTVLNILRFNETFFDERVDVGWHAMDGPPDGPDHVTWIDVIGLGGSKIIQKIGDRYAIHPLLLEDIVHTHQRPKIELIDGRLGVVLRMVQQSSPLVSEQVTFVLTGQTVISFQEREGDVFEVVRQRIRRKLGSIRSQGADYTMYSLIDALIDAFFPLLEDYGRRLEAIEEEHISGSDSESQHHLHVLRGDLSQVRKIAWSHREALHRIVSEASGTVHPTTMPFLRDCHDHTGQILDVAETYREIASDLRELYFSHLGQRTNEVMKLLTIISTIFMPLSFIAGVYGMNFNHETSPLNMPETQWRFGYPLALMMMAIIAGGMVFYFYRKGWLFQR